jgi:hypothetical protein
MEVATIARQRFLDDVTNSVGETFLAHSLQCARCQDHKFDPVPTRDYYSVLPDPRAERNRKHLLVDVVAIGVCGVLVGCDGPTAIRLWAA